jgi:hypothetical protein
MQGCSSGNAGRGLPMKAQQCIRQRAAAKRALRPILGHGEFAEKMDARSWSREFQQHGPAT